MRLITKPLSKDIENDFFYIKETLNLKESTEELVNELQYIHAKLFLLKSVIIKCESNLKSNSVRYLNEFVSDLIESYVMLNQNRYKTSKILLRSSIDCFMRGLYIENISTDMEKGFKENFSNLNKTINGIFKSKGITAGYLSNVHNSLQVKFEEFSKYVHGGATIELSQYVSINEILNPKERIDFKIESAKQMNSYAEETLFYLVLANYTLFIEKCPLKLQNEVIDNLENVHQRILNGDLKAKYFK